MAKIIKLYYATPRNLRKELVYTMEAFMLATKFTFTTEDKA